MPFGGGRRVCLGEQLARNDLFLITVGLLKRLKFEPVENHDYSLDSDLKVDLTFVPLPYPVIVTER